MSGAGMDEMLGMEGDQGQYMHLRWAPGSYRQISPAEQQRLAQYMQAQSMAAQARQQAIQRPTNAPQPVSPQHSPMAAYYSPHIPTLGTGMYVPVNTAAPQPASVARYADALHTVPT